MVAAYGDRISNSLQLILKAVVTRGGVLQDVLGLEDVLEDTFWSPWPWLRSLMSSKIALSSARGQHYFWTVEISLENARNLAESLQRPFFGFLKWRSPEKNFWRPFTLEKYFWRPFCFWFRRTLAFVSLASRGSVPGLGLEIFLCPWPWPRALCSRLHLWLLLLTSVSVFQWNLNLGLKNLAQF